jgi:hypothetical protein
MSTPNPPDISHILREALHADGGAVEPQADGLARIRARLRRPQPLPAALAVHVWSAIASRLAAGTDAARYRSAACEVA